MVITIKQKTKKPERTEIHIDMELGHTDRFKDIVACFEQAVKDSDKEQALIAADLNLASTDLSRRLANNLKNRPLTAIHLEEGLKSCGEAGKLVVYYLIEKILIEGDE